MLGLIQDPQLTLEQSHCQIFFFTMDYTATPKNAKENTVDEAADLFCVEATWDWLNDDLDLHPLTVRITQVMVNVMVQWPPFAWATLRHRSPSVTLLLPNQATITYGNL